MSRRGFAATGIDETSAGTAGPVRGERIGKRRCPLWRLLPAHDVPLSS